MVVFYFLIVFFRAQGFNFDKIKFIFFSLVDCAFGVTAKKTIAKSKATITSVQEYTIK